MVEVHLYGKLRRYAAESQVTKPSLIHLQLSEGMAVKDALDKMGIPREEVANVFINGRYRHQALDVPLWDGDRLGLFPSNMAMLYV
jgi:sulfur carrier protein ThiS